MNRKKSASRSAKPAGKLNNPAVGEIVYRHLFELHDAVLLIVDARTGQIIKANHAAEKFFNIETQAFITKSISDLSGLPIEVFLNKLEAFRQSGRNFVVLPHRFPGGEVKYIEYRCSSVSLPDREVLLCFVQDVTSREQEEYLLQYRIEYESVISSISTYFIKPDHTQLDSAINLALKTVGEFLVADRCYILRFSDDLTKVSMIHHWNTDAVKALALFENQSTDSSPFAYSALLKGEILNTIRVSEIQEDAKLIRKYKQKDDTQSFLIVPMISAGMVLGGIGLDSVHQERKWTEDTITLLRMVGEIITNALRRKQMEEALRESENRYRKFFEEDLTGDYIAAGDGQIRFCNPAFAKIFGFDSREEVLTSKVRIFDLLNESAEQYLNMIRGGQAGTDREFEFHRKKGEIARAIGHISGLFNEQNALEESRGYLFDITEHKKLEEQLRGAQRMEAIGRLAGGIAHDFNNILTVINGHSELLLMQQDQTQAVRSNIELIKKAGDRAASLISQLLAFSRKQIVQPKVINLNMVVKDLESMLHRLIGENIQFKTTLDPDLENIKIDPGQLEQVIMNLVVNAKDAMPSGGILAIETKNRFVNEYDARLLNPQRPGPYVLLTVQDTGIGMDAEIQSHIFEPFFTTKEKGKGTGLGLSTLYGIVKQSDGFVWVESIPQQGASFRIYFPAYHQTAEEERSMPSPGEPRHGHETVLIVEDDDAVRELTRSFLEHFGYTVYSAASGEQALDLCKGLKNNVDLAILDVIMPGINCKDLSKEIAAYFPQIKIMFISGYTDEAITQQGVLEPKVAFLQKPFSIEALGHKVRRVLDSPSS